MWSSSASEAWAVGEEADTTTGMILRWDGSAWSVEPIDLVGLGGLSAVWGSSANDVWAVGQWGVVVHWDGSAWSFVDSGALTSLYGVRGTSAEDIWVVGNGGTILHRGAIERW